MVWLVLIYGQSGLVLPTATLIRLLPYPGHNEEENIIICLRNSHGKCPYLLDIAPSFSAEMPEPNQSRHLDVLLVLTAGTT